LYIRAGVMSSPELKNRGCSAAVGPESHRRTLGTEGNVLGPAGGNRDRLGLPSQCDACLESKDAGRTDELRRSLCLCLVGDLAVYCVVCDAIVWLVRRGCTS
jgi:hypothetical protein